MARPEGSGSVQPGWKSRPFGNTTQGPIWLTWTNLVGVRVPDCLEMNKMSLENTAGLKLMMCSLSSWPASGPDHSEYEHTHGGCRGF
jgi:hypothetical protein